MEDKKPVYLFLMGNCCRCDDNGYLKAKYDLKGSRINRESKPPKGQKEFKRTAVLKDINFLSNRHDDEEEFLLFRKDDIDTIKK